MGQARDADVLNKKKGIRTPTTFDINDVMGGGGGGGGVFIMKHHNHVIFSKKIWRRPLMKAIEIRILCINIK